MPKDIRTKAIVLRRTNYGESDRILHLLTENGEVSVIARSARKEKSKLAGGIEMFCVSEITYHQHQDGRLAVLTSAKMLHEYHHILSDLPRLELASSIIRYISHVASHDAGATYFSIATQAIAALDSGESLELVETWFLFNLAKTSGEEVNVFYDANGEKLKPDQIYLWDSAENALRPQPNGNISASEIKLIRLMLSSSLALVSQVQNLHAMLPPLRYIAKSVNKL